MRINRLSPLGVEVTGLPSVADATDDEIREIVEALFEAHGVLVVRGQDLPPPDLQRALFRFAPYFGAPLRYDRWPGQSKGVSGHPYLSLLGNYRARRDFDFGVECLQGEQIGEFKPAMNVVEEWHTDGSFLGAPKTAIALYAPLRFADRDEEGALPPVGGATRFASCARLYEQLGEAERVRLDGLAAVHSWEAFMRLLEARDPGRPKVTPEDVAAKPDVAWPLVRTHPDTGKRGLFINPKNTRAVVRLAPGWPECVGADVADEGHDFVRELARRVIASGEYAHQWVRGDFVLWDNRMLLHAASPFDAQAYERLLFRCEFSGEPPLYCPLAFPPSSMAAGAAPHPVLQRQCEYRLLCHPGSVAWGYLDARRPVQLVVPDGATVAVDCVNGGPECLPCEADGGWSIPPELLAIHEQVTDRLGPHILTGPIFVRGAAPGDVLRVDILEVALRSNWAWTMARPYGGALEAAEPARVRHTRLDPSARVGRPPWGGELDLRPFFGILGTAPPPGLGRQSSREPRDSFGGNLDCKELVEGTTLYLPVHVVGALLYVGDGHARQGDGECCGTALETSMSGAFRLTVIKAALAEEAPLLQVPPWRVAASRTPVRAPLRRPRAESDASLITLACARGVDEAASLALEEMLDWLSELRPRLARPDAYMLLSVCADVRLTQLVNGASRGAHVVLEKRLLPPA